MERFALWVQRYLIYCAPIAVITAVWCSYSSDVYKTKFSDATFEAVLWNSLNVLSLAWAICIFVFMVLFVSVPGVRERIIRFVARIKERDERESFITGKAALSSWVVTLSLVIFLFFVSMVSVNITRLPKPDPVSGNTRQLEVNLGVGFFNQAPTIKNDSEIFSSSRYTLSA